MGRSDSLEDGIDGFEIRQEGETKTECFQTYLINQNGMLW